MRKLHDIKSTSKAWFDKNGSVKSWFDKNGLKACATVSSVSASIMAMTIPSGAEGFDVSTTADTVISMIEKGLTFCLGQPVLSLTFVAGLMGTVIFGNIKKAKRAVK